MNSDPSSSKALVYRLIKQCEMGKIGLNAFGLKQVGGHDSPLMHVALATRFGITAVFNCEQEESIHPRMVKKKPVPRYCCANQD